jgi:2-polyprenyl-6-methoxyphenol hydroxylase-like FAD-dependent oxidoreductase
MTTAKVERALIVGAGIGGLAAAAALADHAGEVVIVERDTLPETPVPRPGVPQGKHVHGVLGGGLSALEELLPGFGQDLAAAGAVPLRLSLDIQTEQPGYDPFPRRDLGVSSLSCSRALFEHVLRARVTRLPSVRLLTGRTVRTLNLASGSGAVESLTLDDRQVLKAALIVDASGRGALSLDALAQAGIARPPESVIAVNVRYTCAVLRIPDGLDADWKVLQTRPAAEDAGGRRAIMYPLEGERRWLLGLGGVHGDAAPNDPQGFIDYARTLRTPSAAAVLARAAFEGEIVRFAFPASVRRRFEALPAWPAGLIPLGDAVCRINPSYGQGMTLAAQEAVLLKRLAGETPAPATLSRRFLAGLGAVLQHPWSVAAGDFAYPQTTGDRPDDLAALGRFNAALTRLAAEDSQVHRLMLDVAHLRRPPSAYEEAGVTRRLGPV